MDAEAFLRREAAELLAEYPDLTPEEIARELRKDAYDGDPEIAATVLTCAGEMLIRRSIAASVDALVDEIDDEIPW